MGARRQMFLRNQKKISEKNIVQEHIKRKENGSLQVTKREKLLTIFHSYQNDYTESTRLSMFKNLHKVQSEKMNKKNL